MVAPVKITQSSVALKIPTVSELVEGGLAVNVVDGALYSARHDGSVIRIEGDTGNGAIVSGTSIALGAVMAGVVDVTGTATITAIVLREGQTRTVRFTGALTLINSATLVLPGGASIATVAGDFATFRGYASGVTRCTNYVFSPTKYALAAGSSTQAFAALTMTASGQSTGTSEFSSGPAIKATTTAPSLASTFAATNSDSSQFLVGYSGSSGDPAPAIWWRSGAALRFATATNQLASGFSQIVTIDSNGLNGPIGGTTRSAGAFTSLVSSATFGCNGKDAQASFTLGAAATDLPTAIALVNNLRTMAIKNGIGS